MPQGFGGFRPRLGGSIDLLEVSNGNGRKRVVKQTLCIQNQKRKQRKKPRAGFHSSPPGHAPVSSWPPIWLYFLKHQPPSNILTWTIPQGSLRDIQLPNSASTLKHEQT